MNPSLSAKSKVAVRVSNIAVRMSPPLEVRFSNMAASGLIEGYASAFGGPPDAYGDIIDPGAFRQTLAHHKADGTMPAMLWSHDMAQPIGRWTEMKEDDYGLFVRGNLNMGTERGRDALEHLKQRDVSGLSIGFVVAKGGSKLSLEGYRILTGLDLWEVSVVALPANQRARVSDVKSLQTKSELIDLLRDGGLSKAAAARVAAGGWPALGSDETGDLNDLAKAIQAQTEELKSWK